MVKHIDTVERLIRKQLAGTHHTRLRAVTRKLVGEGAAALRRHGAKYSGVGYDHYKATFEALAIEVERVDAANLRRSRQNQEIVTALEKGCPVCGVPIRRNLSITGWYQCSQFGADGFRADSTKPACGWQAFYVES